MTLIIRRLYRGGVETPSIAYITNSNQAHYHPYVPPPPPTYAGDIVYKSNGKLKTINYEEWTDSLGTPVGVVVVPSGFAPDGKARMLSLHWTIGQGGDTTDPYGSSWGRSFDYVSIPNCDMFPTTDNAGSTTTGSNDMGYLPSDKFTGATSYVDSTAKYSGATTSNMIPSPYLGDKPNPAYYAEISGYNNALADFDGKGNTDVIVALGNGYESANGARNYKAAGAEEIEWYLPAAGELGYIMPRLNKIQAALAKVNANELKVDVYSYTYPSYWSSTEITNGITGKIDAVQLELSSGRILGVEKDEAYGGYLTRPFALLP